MQADAHACRLHLPLKRTNHIRGVVADRKYPVAALHLERAARRLKEAHRVLIGKHLKRTVEKARVAHNLRLHFPHRRRIRQIAAPLAGDIDFFS